MTLVDGFRGALAGLAVLAGAASAQAECRLALVLAVDVSQSVDSRDYAIQKDGILAALADPAVVSAFLGAPEPVSFALFEWSRNTHQFLVVDWTLVQTKADLATIRSRIEAHSRMPFAGTTAMGEALRYAGALLDRAPPCDEQVIDVSGDGSNNAGATPAMVYGDPGFPADRVNGLAIRAHELNVAAYYLNHLIHGPGAFVEIAEGTSDFPRAIREKLLRELSDRLLGEAGQAPAPKS